MSEWTQTKIGRRHFLSWSAKGATATVVVHWLSAPSLGKDGSPSALEGHSQGILWASEPGKASRRFEGLAKVTGAKLYGRDFNARDLSGWPKQETRVAILRLTDVDKVYLGVNRAKLVQDLKVTRIITAEDFKKDHIKIPPFFGRTMMAQPKALPEYFGQPAALLYFHDASIYRDVAPNLLNASTYINYGKHQKRPAREPYGQTHLVRYQAEDGIELFSCVQDGEIKPGAPSSPDVKGTINARGAYYSDRIQADLDTKKWRIIEGEFSTQACDPMFMEAESGLAWFDPKTKTLHLTLGTQSPHDDGEACAALFADPHCGVHVKKIVINACYPGGGFGGRDHSDFPLYLALAAIYAKGQPVKISFNRFEQFQAGIKRHAAVIQQTLAVDDKGMLQALKSNILLDGGGQNNFSFSVQAVAAQNASSAYYFPRIDLKSQANATTAVTAGSMRGFGTYQPIFALESCIDQAASELAIDPVVFRRQNLLKKGKKTPTGATPTYEIFSDKLLDAVASCELWRHREGRKKELSRDGKLYGVGLAMVVKSYGTNLDACLAEVHIREDGVIHISSDGIDMGNGSATTLPISIAALLGRNAASVKMGATADFAPLQLTMTYDRSQEQESEHAKNPRWVPNISLSTAASTFPQRLHAVLQAARVLLKCGIWRAACDLWGARGQGQVFDEVKVTWVNGNFIYGDLPPLAWQDLIGRIYAKGYATSAMVHAYYRAQWAKATFLVGEEQLTYPVDALGLRYAGKSQYTLYDRQWVEFPPFKNNRLGVDLYTPFAAVVAVEVDRSSGEVQVVEAETYLDCGPVVHRDIVEGQVHGGFAMGVGHALFEDLPLGEGGPGQGNWNLHLYRVALARDIPIQRLGVNLLNPNPQDPPKGMAEVCFCGVPPAIANAIFHATGKRFKSLPITADKVKKALA